MERIQYRPRRLLPQREVEPKDPKPALGLPRKTGVSSDLLAVRLNSEILVRIPFCRIAHKGLPPRPIPEGREERG
jgi:hypothetical protein